MIKVTYKLEPYDFLGQLNLPTKFSSIIIIFFVSLSEHCGIEGDFYNSYGFRHSDHSEMHRPIRTFTDNHKKKCLYCQFLKIKTRSGYQPNTHFQCDICKVPLCVGTRNCFHMYHSLLMQGKKIELIGRRLSLSDV